MRTWRSSSLRRSGALVVFRSAVTRSRSAWLWRNLSDCLTWQKGPNRNVPETVGPSPSISVNAKSTPQSRFPRAIVPRNATHPPHRQLGSYDRIGEGNDHLGRATPFSRSAPHSTTEQAVRLDRSTKPIDDVRCPYCVDGDEFRLMRQTFDGYTCTKCGHVVFLDGRTCTCMKCRELRASR